MKYKVYIYNGTEFKEVSDFVETNITINDRKDKQFNSASLTLSHVKEDSIPGFDLSKVFKPGTPVEIQMNPGKKTWRFIISNSKKNIIRKNEPRIYRHEISLVEPSKILQKKTIPNFTTSQPASILSVQTAVSENKSFLSSVNNTLTTLTINNLRNTSPSILENTVLKDNTKKYVFEGYLEILNKVANSFMISDAESDLYIEFVSGGNVIQSSVINCPPAKIPWYAWFLDIMPIPTKTSKTIKFEYAPTNPNETVTCRVKTLGTVNYAGVQEPDTLFDLSLVLTIHTNLSDRGYITVEQQVDKCINMINIKTKEEGSAHVYKLSDDTRNMIRDVEADDITTSTYTAWDYLEKIADKFGAFPRIYEYDFRTIKFETLDEEVFNEFEDEGFIEKSSSYELEDYNTGIEINASNVVEEGNIRNVKIEPYALGWMTARADTDISQITDINSVFRTRQNIYKIIKMLIQGVEVILKHSSSPDITLKGNDNSNPTLTTTWDITSRVVEEDRWHALEPGRTDNSDFNRKAYISQGNTIFYKQGNKTVKIGFIPPSKPGFIYSNIAERALLESILTLAAFYIDDNNLTGYTVHGLKNLNDNYKLFRGIKSRIHYLPYSDVRTRVYKRNLDDFHVDFIKYGNEQDKVNDMNNLSKFMFNSLNRIGNEYIGISGRTTNGERIPDVGSFIGKNRITSRNITLSKNIVNFDLELNPDFINYSGRLAPQSVYRQYETEKNNLVKRDDIYREFITLSKTEPGEQQFSALSSAGINKIFENFTNVSPFLSPATYAKLTVNSYEKDSELSTKPMFDLPINRYSVGNTIVLNTEAESNYSIGPQRIDTKIGSDDFIYQKYTEYTNFFGRVYEIFIEVKPRGIFDNSVSDANLYPEFVESSEIDNLLQGTFEIDKDSREIFSLTLEFPVLSDDSENIIVYPGFAKFNGLIMPKADTDIKLALLLEGYKPGKNDTLLKTNRCIILNETAIFNTLTGNKRSFNYTNISLPANTKIEGYAIFEDKTDELLLVVKEPRNNNTNNPITFDTDYIYAIPKRYLFNEVVESVSAKYWSSITTQTYDSTIYIHEDSYTCPVYIELPNPELYNESHILRVIITRDCDPLYETCIFDPNENPIKFCDTRYYKVYIKNDE